MESNTTFFTGTIDPQTGDIRSQRIDTRRELPAHDLVVDVHYSAELIPTWDKALASKLVDIWGIPNTDPTLAQFYEPEQKAKHDDR